VTIDFGPSALASGDSSTTLMATEDTEH
jgi:hypothetical protein